MATKKILAINVSFFFVVAKNSIMSQDRKRVRFSEVALEYNGRQYVSIRPVPLLPSDDDTYDNDQEMGYQFNPYDFQLIEQHLSKVSDPSKYTINFG